MVVALVVHMPVLPVESSGHMWDGVGIPHQLVDVFAFLFAFPPETVDFVNNGLDFMAAARDPFFVTYVYLHNQVICQSLEQDRSPPYCSLDLLRIGGHVTYSCCLSSSYARLDRISFLSMLAHVAIVHGFVLFTCFPMNVSILPRKAPRWRFGVRHVS